MERSHTSACDLGSALSEQSAQPQREGALESVRPGSSRRGSWPAQPQPSWLPCPFSPAAGATPALLQCEHSAQTQPPGKLRAHKAGCDLPWGLALVAFSG